MILNFASLMQAEAGTCIETTEHQDRDKLLKYIENRIDIEQKCLYAVLIEYDGLKAFKFDRCPSTFITSLYAHLFDYLKIDWGLEGGNPVYFIFEYTNYNDVLEFMEMYFENSFIR